MAAQQISHLFAYTTHCNAVGINPREQFLIVKDPILVRAGQLKCLNLLSRLPKQHQADFVVRMYAGIEEKFTSLLQERQDTANNYCEWQGVNWTAFIPSFSNYFVVSTSQNKSITQLDVFLLILCFYRFFGFDLWWNLGIFFRKKHHKTHLSL